MLKTEHFNIAIAETEIVTAGLRPNLNLSNESLQLLNASEFAMNSPWHNNQNRQVFWQVSKPFQIAGQRKNKIEVADKNRIYSEKEYNEAERQLLREVAEKWLAVWAAQKQLEVLKIAQTNTDSLTQINQHRFANQVVTETDLYRTTLLSKQYDIQYKTLLQEWKNLKKELATLLGSVQNVEIDSEDPFYTTLNKDLNSLILEASDTRSDIIATKQLVEVFNSNVKLQKSLAYPQPEIGFIWNPQNHIPYAGISFSIDLPLFNRNQGEIRKSHLLKQQAEQQLLTIENQLHTDINAAYNSYTLHKQNATAFEAIVEKSQIILNNVKYAYLKGGTTIIDFLEAQRAWLETRERYYDVMRQYSQSYMQLLYVTGLINQLAM
jgi:cobalt-zinc-cadmium efflux system outer membrane protein